MRALASLRRATSTFPSKFSHGRVNSSTRLFPRVQPQASIQSLPPSPLIKRQSSNSAAKMSAAAPPSVLNLLILCDPSSPELEVLKKLPADKVNIIGTGSTPAALSHLSDADLAKVNTVLVCGVLSKAPKRDDIRTMFLRLPNLKWMHSAAAGLDHILFPELIASPIPLTNAKSVFSHSLAEWSLFACNYFAKYLDRLLEQKRNKAWIQFEVEELRGKTMGVIGLGDIGSATARLARAHGMRVVGLRRRALSAEEQAERLVDKLYSPEQICELVKESDYIVAATPLTPQTEKMVSKEAIACMKPHAVFINVGRGRCVDEEALIAALKEKKIRGAGLDVFAVEPLPVESPIWDLDNVLISPHSADRTKEFQFEALDLFVDIAKGYLVEGEAGLKNVCDKKAGY